MSAHDVMEALYTRWGVASLDTTVTGGLWLSLAPSGTAYPYCVYNLISNVPESRSNTTSDSGTEVYRTEVQFALYDDKFSDLGAASKTIRTAYDYCSMTLGVDEGQILEIRLSNEIPNKLEDDIWQWVMTYSILRSLPIDPSG